MSWYVILNILTPLLQFPQGPTDDISCDFPSVVNMTFEDDHKALIMSRMDYIQTRHSWSSWSPLIVRNLSYTIVMVYLETIWYSMDILVMA